MRAVIFLFFYTLCFAAVAQVTMDSVEIKTVEIKDHSHPSADRQKVDSLALHNSSNSDFGQSLQKSANLFVKSYGMGSMASISMRGTNSTQSKLLWNGVSLNSSFNGVVDLSLFPTFFIDEAEVLYGLSSLQYESGGLGGAVLMHNKADFSNKKQLQFQQKVGSFGMHSSHLRLDLGGEKIKFVSRIFYKKADNDFKYVNYSKANRPTEKVINGGLEQMGVLQSLYFRMGEKQLLSADFWLYQSQRKIPSLMTSRKLEERQKDAANRLMLRYTNYLKNGKLSLVSALLNNQIDYYNERASSHSTTNSLSSKNYIRFERRFWKKIAIDIKADFNFNTLLSGSENVNEFQREIIAARAEINYAIHPLWNIKANLSEKYIVDQDNFHLGYLQLAHQIISGKQNMKLFSKFGKNVKYPNLNDLYWEPGGNENLTAEQSYTSELGFHFNSKLMPNRIESILEASLYRSNIDNYIQWQPTVFGYWEAKNLKEVQLQGIESRVEIKDNATKIQKKLTLNYTYTQSINTKSNHQFDAAVDQQLIYIPEHQFNLFAHLNWKDYYLQYQYQLMGARYITSDNTEYLPYYQLSDFTLGKKLFFEQHQFQFSFSVLNAFDIDYQAILHRPMPGRNYQIAVNYYFKP